MNKPTEPSPEVAPMQTWTDAERRAIAEGIVRGVRLAAWSTKRNFGEEDAPGVVKYLEELANEQDRIRNMFSDLAVPAVAPMQHEEYPGVGARFKAEFGVDPPFQQRRPKKATGWSGDAECVDADEFDAYADEVEAEIARLRAVPAVAPRETQMEPNWLPIPNEQAWWWHFNGESYTIPHIYSVLVSNTGTPRYFIQYPDSRWCDEVGGWWLKVEYPNVPSREFQESARARLENGGC